MPDGPRTRSPGNPMASDGPAERRPEPPLWETQQAGGERLQKVLARVGFGSRRSCEALIESGRVTVNGDTARLGRRIDVAVDSVEVDGARIGVEPNLVHYLVNKPRGVVCTSSDTHGRPTILDLVPAEPRVFSVGRLDMDSEGLIIVTNDGALAHELTHPSRGVEKEYLVEVESPPSGVPSGALRRLRDGIVLEDGVTAPAQVGQPSAGVLRMVIHEGRNRQIRRMCEAVGHPVVRLVRTRIGTIVDPGLRPGTWRELTIEEVRALSATRTK